MADHMNVFEPYVSKAAHHEDALTRAFLLVLRGVPLAHAAWLGLVDRAHRAAGGTGVPCLHELGTPAVRTQTAVVADSVRRVISLVQTDEVYFREGDAGSSARRQVLDGVVTYDQALAIVVENKPRREHIWDGQLDVNVPPGVEIDKKVACVTWKDIVLAWGGLLEAGHLGSAETVLLGDFLDYVEEHFGHLRPYSKLGLCGTDRERLHRRCRVLLQAIAGEKQVDYHRGWGWYIDLADGQCARKVGMFPDLRASPPALVVELDPGDTTGQARLMFRDVSPDAITALLGEERWSGWPNFHLMYMSTGCFRPRARQPVADYWKAWSGRQQLLRRWNRPEFDDAFAALIQQGVADEGDRAEFVRHTSATKRDHIAFSAGVTLQWRLPLDEAVLLDQRNQLEKVVRDAVQRGADALRIKLPWPAATQPTKGTESPELRPG